MYYTPKILFALGFERAAERLCMWLFVRALKRAAKCFQSVAKSSQEAAESFGKLSTILNPQLSTIVENP